MKTATIPSLRVEPALRLAAQNVLLAGENLSSFVEESIRTNIASRQAQQAFIARGLAGKEQAEKSGQYYSSEHVLSELQNMLTQAEKPH